MLAPDACLDMAEPCMQAVLVYAILPGGNLRGAVTNAQIAGVCMPLHMFLKFDWETQAPAQWGSPAARSPTKAPCPCLQEEQQWQLALEQAEAACQLPQAYATPLVTAPAAAAHAEAVQQAGQLVSDAGEGEASSQQACLWLPNLPIQLNQAQARF